VKGYVSEVLNRHHLRDRTQLVCPPTNPGLSASATTPEPSSVPADHLVGSTCGGEP